MTNTEKFIADAIEGGYDFRKNPLFTPEDQERFARARIQDTLQFLVGFRHAVLLDPKAWEAAGKIRGWIPSVEVAPEHQEQELCWCQPRVLVERDSEIIVHEDHTPIGYMHAMIDALADGKAFEDALPTD